MEKMSDVIISCAALTNVGKVRNNNEDNYLVIPDLENQDEQPESGCSIPQGRMGMLLAVADGMGGANAGEVASAIAIDTVRSSFAKENVEALFAGGKVPSESEIKSFMVQVVKDADINIHDFAKTNESTGGMGTTLVMAWIIGRQIFITWCGDSRCYVYNKSMGLIRLSKDHSYVQELVDRGEISEEDAFDHPYGNIITRCLGDQENRANPDFRTYHLQDKDTIILCSDGLSSVATESEMVDVLSRDETFNADGCCSNLVDAALNAGGYDNVTVAVAQMSMDEVSVTQPDLQTTIKPKGKKSGGRLFVLLASLVVVVALALCLFLFKPDIINLVK